LALDSRGFPHISYGGGAADLKYARWIGDNWFIDVVDNTIFCQHTSLALDHHNRPHISYQDHSEEDLRYAYKTYDGGWDIEIVDSAGFVGDYSSIALDSLGRPRIAYRAQPSFLRYAWWTGKSWVIETADTLGDYHISLALDRQDRPHIAHFDAGSDDLRYTHWTGMEWTTEIVDSQGYVGIRTDITIDSKGNPHISYSSWGAPGDLRYAYLEGGEWIIEFVCADGGSYTSIELDEWDRPRIAFCGIDDLEYASWEGWAWRIWPWVDTLGTVGWYASLALDRYGNPHIAYFDMSNLMLKYARYVPDTYRMTCEDTRNFNEYPGLTLTPNPTRGAIRISFSLRANDHALIHIYDAVGRLIRFLKTPHGQIKGTIQWDGTDSIGNDVPSGTYFCEMKAGTEREIRRFLLLR
jgi:hypothetical protein